MVQDAADAELASRQLRASGLDFELRRAADEPAFREALRAFRPHVILSDYSLPGLEGVAALEIARRAARDRGDAPWSGRLRAQIERRASRAGHRACNRGGGEAPPQARGGAPH